MPGFWLFEFQSETDFYQKSLERRTNSKDSGGNILWKTLIFLAMIVGMLVNQMFVRSKQLEDGGDKSINFGELFRYGYRGFSFVRGLLVSPIVFWAIVQAANIDTHSIGVVILSFQNGFFWLTIFSKDSKG